MSTKLILVTLLASMVAAFAATAEGSQYTNSEFDFAVALPSGASTCRSQAPEHDGGLSLFLDSGPDGCEALQSRPFIGVYASYNSMLAPTPEEVLKLTLGHPVGKSGEAPQGLEIPGMSSASSRWDRDDGWVDIRVAAQGGRWPDNGGEPEQEVPYVNYTVILHTTKERLAQDIERLRAVLRDVRISREE
ncbi:MAG: hypothetical protein HC882_07910 [Acidobacteria bacterium]|nr:hypothetical protein [Acidobacteriota bacterium]